MFGADMQVIFKGEHSIEQSIESLDTIIQLFKERYGIHKFRELKLSMVLIDEQGDDVELVDSRTSEVFQLFEVYQSGQTIKPISRHAVGPLQLVVDNTRQTLLSDSYEG